MRKKVESSPRVRVEVGSKLYRGSKDDFDRVNWFALISNWHGLLAFTSISNHQGV
jgi:hypothetical protein